MGICQLPGTYNHAVHITVHINPFAARKTRQTRETATARVVQTDTIVRSISKIWYRFKMATPPIFVNLHGFNTPLVPQRLVDVMGRGRDARGIRLDFQEEWGSPRETLYVDVKLAMKKSFAKGFFFQASVYSVLTESRRDLLFFGREDVQVGPSSLVRDGADMGIGFFGVNDNNVGEILHQFVGDVRYIRDVVLDEYTIRLDEVLVMCCADHLPLCKASRCNSYLDAKRRTSLEWMSKNAEIYADLSDYSEPKIYLRSTKRNGVQGEYAVDYGSDFNLRGKGHTT
jgi:hypothetical protein